MVPTIRNRAANILEDFTKQRHAFLAHKIFLIATALSYKLKKGHIYLLLFLCLLSVGCNNENKSTFYYESGKKDTKKIRTWGNGMDSPRGGMKMDRSNLKQDTKMGRSTEFVYFDIKIDKKNRKLTEKMAKRKGWLSFGTLWNVRSISKLEK